MNSRALLALLAVAGSLSLAATASVAARVPSKSMAAATNRCPAFVHWEDWLGGVRVHAYVDFHPSDLCNGRHVEDAYVHITRSCGPAFDSGRIYTARASSPSDTRLYSVSKVAFDSLLSGCRTNTNYGYDYFPSGGAAPPPPPAAPPPPPVAPPPETWTETSGPPSGSGTFSNYTNAGGTIGTRIAPYQTVQVSCKVQGFKVADGDPWWYRVASSPWNNQFYASSDNFYNNGQTSGSLNNGVVVDANVPDC